MPAVGPSRRSLPRCCSRSLVARRSPAGCGRPQFSGADRARGRSGQRALRRQRARRSTAKLADLENKSGIQLVVATVSSLDGQEIEPYANELFRAWKLGEAKKNNGVLFLVAPKEHKMRIEVGYGLEGTLTDATSKIIIANAVAPRFKAGDFDGGVSRGVDDIITMLTTDSADWQKRPELRAEDVASTLDRLALRCCSSGIFIFIFVSCRAPAGGIGRAMLYILAAERRFGGGGGFVRRRRFLRRRRIFRRRRIVGRRRRLGELVMPIGHEDAPAHRSGLHAPRKRARRRRSSACWRSASALRNRAAVWSALIALARALAAAGVHRMLRAAHFPRQLVVFLVAIVILTLPALRLLLTPARVRRANAHRAALEQFLLARPRRIAPSATAC